MKMGIKVDSKRVEKMLNNAIRKTPAVVANALDKTTGNASNDLIDRTEGGKGVNYSKDRYSGSDTSPISGYAKYRQSKGRQIQFVDLNFSGAMLGDVLPFKAKISGQKIWSEIRPARAEEAKKVFYTDKQRHWWGFSTKEQRHISKEFQRFFVAEFRRKVK